MMMNKELYLKEIAGFDYDCRFLKDKSVLISGSSGLIGSYLIDVLMYYNNQTDLNCKIYAIGRSRPKLEERFIDHVGSKQFSIIEHNINEPLILNEDIDYVLHLASNTNPSLYVKKPIETITTNVFGTCNLLNIATRCHSKRFLFASSVEVYGKKDGNGKLTEDDFGYLDPNKLRSGYPEAKRCSEALCQAFFKEKNMDFVIARLCRVYGPSMKVDDSKSTSSFLFDAVKGKDIILKSNGQQQFSFCYVKDAVEAILLLLEKGETSEAYNIVDEESDATLGTFASIVAEASGTEIKYEIPKEYERTGFNNNTSFLLDGSKIKQLGWIPEVHLKEGVCRTLSVLSDKHER